MVNNTIKNFISQHQLIVPGSTIIVGLSGGPDSVFLLHQLKQLEQDLQLTFIAAHLNHGWRTEAGHDEQFCRELAAQLNIPFVAAHASEFPHITKDGSPEAHGRNLRRAFFAQVAQQYPGSLVALAHHQDDQVETFFIRLIRGAGLQGLRGMKPRDGVYIRPLLAISKAEILEYLHKNNIPYCLDHTNEQDTYLRNRIRKHAIPALQSCDNRAEQSVLRTMQHFEQIDDFVQNQVQDTFAAIAELRDTKYWVSLEKFFALHPFMQQQILLHWLCLENLPFTPSASLFDEMIRFLKQPTGGQHEFYQSWVVLKKSGYAKLQGK